MSKISTEILETNNPDWGFFGTIGHHACSEKVWPMAFRAIMDATGSMPDGVLGFLDSRDGRHFADDVANGLFDGNSLEGAIRAAVARWMGWRTTRFHEQDYGAPRGLPVLTALTAFYEIDADMVA